jgi:hypothetical protein
MNPPRGDTQGKLAGLQAWSNRGPAWDGFVGYTEFKTQKSGQGCPGEVEVEEGSIPALDR